MTASGDLAARFSKIYVAAISDCLDRIGLRYQSLPCDLFSLNPDDHIAGPAYTVRGRPSDETNSSRRIGPRVLDSVPAGSVICYDADGDLRAGIWGELWTAGAVARGVAGAIVDGAIRDTARIREYDFPIFHRARRPTDATGRFSVVDHGEPIQMAGVTVRPGDMIVADHDGAVVVPQEHILEVLTAAEERVSREKEMRNSLDAGGNVQEVYEQYEHF